MRRGRHTVVASVLGLISTFAFTPPVARALDDLLLVERPEESRIAGRDGKDEAGTAVAVGDVSGDGIGDILIGVPQSDGISNTRPTSGEVAVVFGAPSLPLNLPIANAQHTFFGASNNANLGTSVAVADLNADGAGDIVMGAPKADTREQGGAGAVYVFFGGNLLASDKSTDLAVAHADAILYGTQDGGRLGVALAVGDFNGDGRQDLAFSAPREGDQYDRPLAGIVYIFFGRPGLARGIEVTPVTPPGYQMTVLGPAANAFAGRALAAGDVNNDGIDDLLIGTTTTGAFGRIDSGDVYVIFGRTALVPDITLDLANPGNIDLQIQGPLAGDLFARALGAADVNGDGVTDMLIGAPQSHYVPGIPTGRAYAVFGRPFVRGTVLDLAATPADVTLAGPHQDAELGFSVSGGDMNGDQFAEWIVGAPGADLYGQAYRILGRSAWGELGVVGALTQGAQKGDRAGAATVVGDVTGDGIGELVMASPLFEVNVDERRDQGAVYVIRGHDRDEVPSENCVDDDGDGFRRQGRTCGPKDCDDTNPSIHPYGPEICGDGLDNNCDGFADLDGIDEDGDGWPGGPVTNDCVVLDCDDKSFGVNPGAKEDCTNGIDDNCDGVADAADTDSCPVSAEVCGNCLDDDGDGLGDVLEEACPAASLQVKELAAQRTKKKPTWAKKVVVKGRVFDAPQLTGDAVVQHGLTVAIAFPSGHQLCVPVGPGKRAVDGTVVLKSSSKPRTVLRLKSKRTGRTKWTLQYKAPLELPGTAPMMLAVGLYMPDTSMPYRGLVELRSKGRALVLGRVVQ